MNYAEVLQNVQASRTRCRILASLLQVLWNANSLGRVDFVAFLALNVIKLILLAGVVVVDTVVGDIFLNLCDLLGFFLGGL